MEWQTIWRDFNVVFSGLALFLVTKWYLKYRHKWTFQEREILRAMIALLIGALLGSLWGALAHFDFNIGMVFVTIGSVHAVQAALRRPQRYAREDQGLSPSPDELAARIQRSRHRRQR